MFFNYTEDGRVIIYEITIEVRQLALKMLFPQPPTIDQICEAIEIVFANNAAVRDGMIELLLNSSGERETTFEVGDTIKFQEAGEPIGFIDLQTRTLFDA